MMTTVPRLLAYDAEHPEGAGTSDREKLWLYSMVRLLEPDTVVEIGTSRGHATAWLAAALMDNQRGTLVTVDNWSRRHGGKANGPEPARQRLAECGVAGFATIVSSDSTAYLAAIEPASVDFIYVDGDHSYEGALADIEKALVASRRVVAVHDTENFTAGVAVRRACVTASARCGCPHHEAFIPGGRGFWYCHLER